MLKFFFSRSIKHKLIYSIAAVHAVLMSVFIVDLVSRQHAFLVSESKAATTGIARTLATNSIPWVLSNDLAGLEEIITSQSQQANFRFAMITDTKGKILSYYNEKAPTEKRAGKYISDTNFPLNAAPDDLMIFFDDDTVIDIAAPIFVDATLLGWARVQMSRSNISKSLLYITKEGLVYTLFAILIGTLIAWIMGRNLTKGIYQLISTTQKVRAGERNINIALNRKDELQNLSDNFQAMLVDLEEKERDLHAEKERAEITLKSIGDGVITTDRDGKITYLNPVSEHLTGWGNFAAKGQPMEQVFRIFHEQTLEPAVNPALKSMETRKIIGLANHTILINRAGEKISIEDSGAPIIDKSGEVIGSVLVFHDATEARQLKERLTWQAMHDSLTGLHNRQAFENKLDELIEAGAESPQLQHCLIYIDLDQFKIVNDTVGHSAGDELLKQVARILQDQIRDSDMLARIGGDEFAILLENCPTNNAETVAEKIRSSIEQYRFTWEDRTFDIGTSIGIASIQGSVSKAAVMSQADMACYLAKDRGRNRIHLFREDDQILAKEFSQLDWVNKIKQAVEKEQFVLFAQEIIPLQTQPDKRAFEILVRLKTENGDLITPDQFLPAAERFNLMASLDTYVVQHAIEWLKNNESRINYLNINISGQSLDNTQFNHILLNLLQDSPELNSKLCFEITETTAITHMSASIAFLNSIKNYGCKLALDDFGSGFSSFGWLKTLPVDYVKIDGSFVLDVLSDTVDAAMVRAIHQISQEMDIQSIAEFVENADVADWLKQVGIGYAQGYHFHKPTSIDEIF
ncbi:EAL domain-containing protein [Thiomicrorhabdus sp.]|uniref:EAL domain-containing protein n=1 Tax=Thiomicrorhabdus sp. TaxID=2039724 RepID=UPI00356780D0